MFKQKKKKKSTHGFKLEITPNDRLHLLILSIPIKRRITAQQKVPAERAESNVRTELMSTTDFRPLSGSLSTASLDRLTWWHLLPKYRLVYRVQLSWRFQEPCTQGSIEGFSKPLSSALRGTLCKNEIWVKRLQRDNRRLTPHVVVKTLKVLSSNTLDSYTNSPNNTIESVPIQGMSISCSHFFLYQTDDKSRKKNMENTATYPEISNTKRRIFSFTPEQEIFRFKIWQKKR